MLGEYGRSYELLIVDDGSTDDTFAQLAAFQARDPRLRVIRFRRNFGQTAAFAAGIAYARGRLVVISDGDLQNDPRDIPQMVARIEQGNDIVCGWRKDRKDTFVTRRVPSILANKLISWATGVALHDYGCSLKVFRAEVIKPLRLYGEMHRFLPAIASQIGVSIDEMVVNHRARRAGTSKYGLSRTVRVVLDLATVKFLLSYSTRPLQIFGLLGLMAVRRRHAHHRLAGLRAAVRAPGDWRSAAAAARRDADLHRRAAGDVRPAGRADGAHLLRVAEQAHLRHPRGPPDGGTGDGRRLMPPGAPREHDPRITVIQQELFNEKRSKVDKYRELVVGQPGLWPLIKYELVMLLASWVPGALGLFLRSKLFPLVLGTVGRNVVFGVNVTLRHPHKIQIGDNVVVDDQCCLDAKGTDNRGLFIGNGVFIGRNTILSCKNGDIIIEDHANIGFNCEIFSASRVRVGKSILMAAYTYLVGGDHLYDRVDIPVLEQGRTARGIDVGDGVWLGTHVVVTDGSTIGRDAIIGAGAVVVGEIPEFAIATGIPAKVMRDRRERQTATGSRQTERTGNRQPAAGRRVVNVSPLRWLRCPTAR